jgi:hypothetical protein
MWIVIAFWVLLAIAIACWVWANCVSEPDGWVSLFVGAAGNIVLFVNLAVMGWHLFGPWAIKECGCRKRAGSEQVEHLGPK